MPDMNAGEWATWVGSAAATVAAMASVALLWRGRTSVAWELQEADRGRSRVVNVGTARAKQVHVRVGSAADESNVDAEERAASVAPGEAVRVLVAATFGSPKDFAVVVTWRGPFGQVRKWTHTVF